MSFALGHIITHIHTFTAYATEQQYSLIHSTNQTKSLQFVHLYTHVFMRTCVYASVCVYMCVCVCARMCVCDIYIYIFILLYGHALLAQAFSNVGNFSRVWKYEISTYTLRSQVHLIVVSMIYIMLSLHKV